VSEDTPSHKRVLGVLRVEHGEGVIRIEHRIETDADDLWSALTDPERLFCWYGEVEGELRLGAEHRVKVHATGWEGTGRVTACEPPHRFAVVGKETGEAYEDHTLVVLTPEEHQTTVVVEQRGVPFEWLYAFGAGMQLHVEDLERHILGQSPDACARSRDDTDTLFRELESAYKPLQPDSRE
jgi:uncharacterized protein YndB with AHSA1/START domain